MEYGEDGSQGSYHTPKLGEENVIPVPVMEPILPPANQSTIVDECSVLRTQVESMGDNLCRSRLRKKLLDSFLLISF